MIADNNVCEQRDDNKPGSSQTSCETTLVADPFAQGGFKLLGCNTVEVITNVQV